MAGVAALVFDESIADVHDVYGGRFGADLIGVDEDRPAFIDSGSGTTFGPAPLVEAALRSPVPAPRQVFAMGPNYRSHAEESDMAAPSVPATFTRFPARPGPRTPRPDLDCRDGTKVTSVGG